MEVRYVADPIRFQRMTTSEIRDSFLVDKLFASDTIYLLYSEVDRGIVGSAVPGKKKLILSASKELAAEYLERYIRKNPSHLDFLFSLCGVYYRMGRSGEAQEICHRILRQNPEHKEAKELSKKIQREGVR